MWNDRKSQLLWELTKSSELVDDSLRYLPITQRKTSKHGKEVRECSKQRAKLFKQQHSFIVNQHQSKLRK